MTPNGELTLQVNLILEDGRGRAVWSEQESEYFGDVDAKVMNTVSANTGADQAAWRRYDACSLLRDCGPFK